MRGALEVGVGPDDEAHVRLFLFLTADGEEALLFDQAQQALLHGEVEFVDLVEEQGAALGPLEGAHA